MKRFPLQGERSIGRTHDGKILHLPRTSIPWAAAEIAYAAYSAKYGTGQSLERLAERGGFGIFEFIDLLAGDGGWEPTP